MSSLQTLVKGLKDEIAGIRHDLHAHPELGFSEVRTSGVVKRELGNAGIQFADGLAKGKNVPANLPPPSKEGTGVLAYLPATSRDPETAPTIALRADMDALPIIENTGKSYASQSSGVMHACGHDGHTSIMIGTAKALNSVDRPNNILLLFQPAEEGGCGGQRMCEDGVLNGSVLGKPAERIFGLHGNTYLPVGRLATRKGPLLASADSFEITIRGKGGHAAMPHVAADPIVAGSHIVVALQTIVSRNAAPLEPMVVTVGEFHAGTASNIIPESARIVGTLRALSKATADLGKRRIPEIAMETAKALGCEMEISWQEGYPVTWNDPVATEDFRRAAGEAFGDLLDLNDCDPVMGAEDFSFYGAHVPACFYWLGLVPEGQDRLPNLHSDKFDFNDEALVPGIEAMCSLALADYPTLGGGLVNKIHQTTA